MPNAFADAILSAALDAVKRKQVSLFAQAYQFHAVAWAWLRTIDPMLMAQILLIAGKATPAQCRAITDRCPNTLRSGHGGEGRYCTPCANEFRKLHALTHADLFQDESVSSTDSAPSSSRAPSKGS